MPNNVIEVNEHTANVPVPADGEAANGASLLALAQPLANRGANHLARITALEQGLEWCSCSVGMVSLASGSNATLTILDSHGAFSINTNRLVLPKSGLWLFHYSAATTADAATDNLLVETRMVVGSGDSHQMSSTRFSTNPSHPVQISGSYVGDVPNNLTDFLRVFPQGSTQTLFYGGSGRLTAIKLKE